MTVLLSHSMVLFFFFSNLMVPFSYYGVPTLYVTALLSHFMVLLFFLTLMVLSSYWGVLSFWVFDFLLLSLSFSIVYTSLFSFVSLKFFSSKPSTRTYLEWRLLNKTLSKTHNRINRSLSHERYLTNSIEGIVLAKQ